MVKDHQSHGWLVNLKDPAGSLARWSLRLQEFDMTVVRKSGRKHSDADCLSRAAVEAEPACTDDDYDECFHGAVNVSDLTALQRADSQLRALIKHVEGRGTTVPGFLLRALPTFDIRQGVLFKENFGDGKTAWLSVVPAAFARKVSKVVMTT